jgi:phosphohistidine phosphatase
VTPDAGPRLLLLVRHAKSAWPDVADHERPLAPRGRRQAPLVGGWLRVHGYRPDLVLCSTARRARETWQLIAAELGTSPHLIPEQRVYGAAGPGLLGLVRETPGAVSALLLVGHDPGVPDLAGTLAGGAAGGAAAGALRRMAAKFPTGAVAVLTVQGAWRDLGSGGARLTDFVVPRDLER